MSRWSWAWAGLGPAFRGIQLAASFLTILPLAGRRRASAAELADTLAWFPLIGFALGAALLLEDFLLSFITTGAVRAVLSVLTLAALSGAVHLDGVGDTADALGAGRDRMRALEIMHDSRIGGFGATAIVFVLALKMAALASAAEPARRLALYLAPGLARWGMVAVQHRMSYLREQGAGSMLLGIREGRNLRVASIIALLALLPIAPAAALRAAVAALIIVSLSRSCYQYWLGGVTGDLIGAAGELMEAAVMVAVAS